MCLDSPEYNPCSRFLWLCGKLRHSDPGCRQKYGDMRWSLHEALMWDPISAWDITDGKCDNQGRPVTLTNSHLIAAYHFTLLGATAHLGPTFRCVFRLPRSDQLPGSVHSFHKRHPWGARRWKAEPPPLPSGSLGASYGIPLPTLARMNADAL